MEKGQAFARLFCPTGEVGLELGVLGKYQESEELLWAGNTNGLMLD